MTRGLEADAASGTDAAQPEGDPAPGARSVLRDHDFRSLLASRTSSTVASAVTWVVLPLYVYTVSHSSLLAGVASAMNVVPYIFFGIVVGAMVDRASPLRVMIAVELCNAAILSTVPLLHLGHVLSVAVLCAVGFASATAFVWFDVASSTLVPAIVGKGAVFHANGYLWSVGTLVTAVAAPLGFFLLNRWGIGWTFATLALFYLLSAALLRLVRPGRDAADGAGADRAAQPPSRRGQDMIEGLRFIAAEPTIRLLTIIGMGSGISAGAIYGMIVVFANRTLGLATGDYRIAWIITGSSLGALLASFAAPRLRHFDAVRTVRSLLVVDTVLMAAYALSTGWIMTLGVILLWNLAHTTLMIVSISVRQVIAPARLQGRVNAAGRMLAWGSVPLGSAVCGAVTGSVGSREATLLLATPVAACTLLALAVPARHSTQSQPEVTG
jgi:predicted MFS family arabinose efflux permease